MPLSDIRTCSPAANKSKRFKPNMLPALTDMPIEHPAGRGEERVGKMDEAIPSEIARPGSRRRGGLFLRRAEILKRSAYRAPAVLELQKTGVVQFRTAEIER